MRGACWPTARIDAKVLRRPMAELFRGHLGIARTAEVLSVGIVVTAAEGERDLVVHHPGKRGEPIVEAPLA